MNKKLDRDIVLNAPSSIQQQNTERAAQSTTAGHGALPRPTADDYGQSQARPRDYPQTIKGGIQSVGRTLKCAAREGARPRGQIPSRTERE
eukprot:8798922-Pyramimonas_sp.AAC.1